MRAILTYHSIDSSRSPISIDEGEFRAHVAWLAAGPCRVVALEKLLTLPDDEAAVALTFDDGFNNFSQVAWPLLREHRFPATVFVVTDHVGGDNAWRSAKASAVPTLPLMNWDALGRIAEEGVTLGSHTRTHENLRLASSATLLDEIKGAAEQIHARTGQHPKSFAYPYGMFNRAAVALVKATHELACSTELRALSSNDDPVRLPRLDAYYFRRAGTLETWGSAAFRRYVWLRASGRLMRRALERTGAL